MFSSEQTVLVVIDIQGKLARLMHQRDELVQNVTKLIKAADILNIPVLLTEQVPEKIGKTIPEITKLLEGDLPITKSCFNCCEEESFNRELESLNRKQIVVAGIEAHVCVYQTVVDLLNKGFEIQVAGDAVSSRAHDNKYFALDRIKCLGGGITSTEMIICEWIKNAKHPKFKEVMALIK